MLPNELTELELNDADLSVDTLVRLNLDSDKLYYDIYTMGIDIILECKYHTLRKLAKALGLKPVSKKQDYLQAVIKHCILFTYAVFN